MEFHYLVIQTGTTSNALAGFLDEADANLFAQHMSDIFHGLQYTVISPDPLCDSYSVVRNTFDRGELIIEPEDIAPSEPDESTETTENMFKPYDAFNTARKIATEDADIISAQLSKIILNSYYGKFPRCTKMFNEDMQCVRHHDHSGAHAVVM